MKCGKTKLTSFFKLSKLFLEDNNSIPFLKLSLTDMMQVLNNILKPLFNYIKNNIDVEIDTTDETDNQEILSYVKAFKIAIGSIFLMFIIQAEDTIAFMGAMGWEKRGNDFNMKKDDNHLLNNFPKSLQNLLGTSLTSLKSSDQSLLALAKKAQRITSTNGNITGKFGDSGLFTETRTNKDGNEENKLIRSFTLFRFRWHKLS